MTGAADQQGALAIAEQSFGPNHPNVATVLGSLGELLVDLGEFDAAESLLERCLSIRNDPQSNPSRRAFPLRGLARVRQAAGDLAEAERLYREALSLFENGPSATQRNIRLTRTLLAELLRSTGRQAEADELLADLPVETGP